MNLPNQSINMENRVWGCWSRQFLKKKNNVWHWLFENSWYTKRLSLDTLPLRSGGCYTTNFVIGSDICIHNCTRLAGKSTINIRYLLKSFCRFHNNLEYNYLVQIAIGFRTIHKFFKTVVHFQILLKLGDSLWWRTFGICRYWN